MVGRIHFLAESHDCTPEVHRNQQPVSLAWHKDWKLILLHTSKAHL